MNDWIKIFFSGRNQLRWEHIESRAAQPGELDNVEPWLKLLQLVDYEGVTILPLYGNDQKITWYAMAGNDQNFAQLRNEITAFIGPSYSDFGAMGNELNPDDEQEGVLSQQFQNRVVKFSAVPPNNNIKLESSLKLYYSLLTRRPKIPDRTQRPFGVIRADFDRALLAGNADNAQKLLEELLATGRVNAEQRKCIEIRKLAGLGQYEAIARSTPLISSVSEICPLPAQTLVDIVVALYETYITPIEAIGEYQNIVEAFKKYISKPFSSLFRERKGIRHPTLLRAFLLFELVANEPNYERCQSILNAYPDTAEGYQLANTWFGNLREIIAAPEIENREREDLSSQAKQAIGDEDYSNAIALCFRLIPDQWAYAGLLRCAIELDDHDITQRVLDTFNTIPDEYLNRLNRKDHDRLNTLRSGVLDGNISGWLDWARSVSANPLTAPTLLELQDTATKWSVHEYANNINVCDELSTCIVEAGNPAQVKFRDAFPVLVDFFESGIEPQRAFHSIYLALIKCLAWSGILSPDELEIGFQLTKALLSTGPGDNEYAEVIEDLKEILRVNKSPINFNWGLNLAELLSLHPAPDGGGAKLGFFMDVLNMLMEHVHRVSLIHRNVLSSLAQDYQCTEVLNGFPAISSEGNGDNEPAHDYTGVIGIYTLTEGAGQRVRDIIINMYPNVEVKLNGDSVATTQLTTLARTADIFVFAWKSSKHQAYYCVKDARQGKEILLPPGKGSASILSVVLNAISSR